MKIRIVQSLDFLVMELIKWVIHINLIVLNLATQKKCGNISMKILSEILNNYEFFMKVGSSVMYHIPYLIYMGKS
jgi:hypothetical protein